MSKIRSLLLIFILFFSSFGGESLHAEIGINPYASSFSMNNRNVLNTWITRKITVKKNNTNTTTYLAFVRSVVTKINTLKSNTTSSKQIRVLGYLNYELNNIINQIDDESLFLDEIDIPDAIPRPPVPVDSTIPPNNTTVNSLAGSSEYIPFVHNGSTDFKKKFEPGVGSLYISEFQGTNKDSTRIHNQKSNHTLLKFKIFIPPGTRRLGLSMGTYVSDTEGKVAAAFGRLPTLTADQINTTEAGMVDSSRVLELLYSGKEVQFHSPGMAGFIIMAQPNYLLDSSMTAIGQWAYFNVLSIPGNKIADQFASVDVDQRCYRSWYKKAVRENLFDASGNPIETKNGVPYHHTVEDEDLAYCRGM